MNMTVTTRQQGTEIEDLAYDYLIQHGLELRVRNYTSQYGEIDLIMQDKKHLVFIEVRYRRQSNYGSAAATVHRYKQRKIIKTATQYLLCNKLYDKIPCRFDVIAVTVQKDKPVIEWIRDAFSAY